MTWGWNPTVHRRRSSPSRETRFHLTGKFRLHTIRSSRAPFPEKRSTTLASRATKVSTWQCESMVRTSPGKGATANGRFYVRTTSSWFRCNKGRRARITGRADSSAREAGWGQFTLIKCSPVTKDRALIMHFCPWDTGSSSNPMLPTTPRKASRVAHPNEALKKSKSPRTNSAHLRNRSSVSQ